MLSGRLPQLVYRAVATAVRYDRALACELAGQRARAKAELERIFGADPGYEDVRERLQAMAGG